MASLRFDVVQAWTRRARGNPRSRKGLGLFLATAGGVAFASYLTAASLPLPGRDPRPIIERFSSRVSPLGRFELRHRGPIGLRAEDGRLVIEASASDAEESAADLAIVGPFRPLDSGRVALRFRAPARDTSAAVVLALESAGTASPWGIRLSPVPLGIALGPTTAPQSPVAPPVHPDCAARDASVPLRFDDDHDWHELDLRPLPAEHALLVSLDGAVVGRCRLPWRPGGPVRPVYEVVGQRPDRPLLVELLELRDERPIATADRVVVADHFGTGPLQSALLEPTRWRINPFDPLRANGLVEMTGSGLHLTVHARPGPTTAMQVIGPTMELASFEASLQLKVHRLHHASVVLGVTNRLFGSRAWRAFHAGVGGPSDHPVPESGEVEIRIGYDAPTGRGTATINGTRVASRRVELTPGEVVNVQVAVNLGAEDAEADATVTAVDLRGGR